MIVIVGSTMMGMIGRMRGDEFLCFDAEVRSLKLVEVEGNG